MVNRVDAARQDRRANRRGRTQSVSTTVRSAERLCVFAFDEIVAGVSGPRTRWMGLNDTMHITA